METEYRLPDTILLRDAFMAHDFEGFLASVAGDRQSASRRRLTIVVRSTRASDQRAVLRHRDPVAFSTNTSRSPIILRNGCIQVDAPLPRNHVRLDQCLPHPGRCTYGGEVVSPTKKEAARSPASSHISGLHSGQMSTSSHLRGVILRADTRDLCRPCADSLLSMLLRNSLLVAPTHRRPLNLRQVRPETCRRAEGAR